MHLHLYVESLRLQNLSTPTLIHLKRITLVNPFHSQESFIMFVNTQNLRLIKLKCKFYNVNTKNILFSFCVHYKMHINFELTNVKY